MPLFSVWEEHNSNCVTCQMAEKLQKVAKCTQLILKSKEVFLGKPRKNKTFDSCHVYLSKSNVTLIPNT